MSSLSESYNSASDICHCDVRARVRTTYTLKNYGRRFMGCANYTSQGSSGCNYFKWVDGVFNSQAEYVIEKLVKQKKELEAKNKMLEDKLKAKEQGATRIVLLIVVLIIGVIAIKL